MSYVWAPVPQGKQARRAPLRPGPEEVSPASGPHQVALAGQRVFGNQVMGRLLQAKLVIHPPDDEFEREADQVAERVMHAAGSGRETSGHCACERSSAPGKECEECRRKHVTLQRRSTSLPAPFIGPPIVHEALRSPGRGLESDTRNLMEARFGHDFSAVRVHTGAKASQSAAAVQARAYTVGRDMVFGATQYSPGTREGQRLLAHELTHVLQQANRSGVNGLSTRANRDSVRQDALSVNIVKVPKIQSESLGVLTLMRDVISATPSPSGGGGHPPSGLTGCHVFLGGRRIQDWLAGTLGFRHLYLDVHEGPANYALIEGGPIGSSTSGTSGAWVKNMDWDARGVQWDLTPFIRDCPNFIACLKRKTAAYHGAAHPYHYSDGPNSNSFVWWVLSQCGLNVSFLLSSYPYRGYDYWKLRPTAAPRPAPAAP